MRLFKRGKIYYVEYARNKRKSLGVTDQKQAENILRKLEKARMEEKIEYLDSKKGMVISDFITHWTDNPDRKELSGDTLRNDALAFRHLKDVLGDVSMKKIDKDAIRRFKSVSIKRVKAVSVNTYLRHIKSGLNWAKQEGIITDVPAIKMYKTGKGLPRYLGKEDVHKILDYAKLKHPEMHRIIIFALYTGSRRKEITQAKYEHIQDGIIKLYGKGNKERVVPLLPDALKKRNGKGKIFAYSHVSTLTNYFKKIVNACGIDAKFHDLRHTAGTQMLTKGIPLKIVKEILGHSDIRTTEIYAQVLSEIVNQEMQKLDYD
jgi:integrase